jgi:hypothetical protein
MEYSKAKMTSSDDKSFYFMPFTLGYEPDEGLPIQTLLQILINLTSFMGTLNSIRLQKKKIPSQSKMFLKSKHI